jgi:hypothetical protein
MAVVVRFKNLSHFSTVISSPPYFNCNFNIRNLLWGFSFNFKLIYFVSINKYSFTVVGTSHKNE